MKTIQVAVALLAGAAVMSPNLHAQAPAKPSPYSGVSQPPPDETIIADDSAAANPASSSAAKLVARPAVAAAAPVDPASSVGPAIAASVPQAEKWNPDYGMIGDAPGTLSTPVVVKPMAPAEAGDPDAGIVTVVPSNPGELPEGTVIRMALAEELSTTESQSGSDFRGRVATDVLYSGRVVIPQGSEVVGKVLRVTEGRRFGSPATIRLRPDMVVLPDGSRYVMRAQITNTDGKTRIDSEGNLKPRSQLKKNAIKEGAGIGTGAVAGALVGGAPGALVGSLIGAGVMTTNILVQHPAEVTVPRDSTLTLSLTQPMLITPQGDR